MVNIFLHDDPNRYVAPTWPGDRATHACTTLKSDQEIPCVHRHKCEVQITHEKLYVARKSLDEHEAYVMTRAATEILEKLGGGAGISENPFLSHLEACRSEFVEAKRGKDFKLLKELNDAQSIGPIIVGLRRSVHILQLGASVDEMVNMAAVAVLDAQEREKRKKARLEETAETNAP